MSEYFQRCLTYISIIQLIEERHGKKL
uniref:Uncharacterized protein n=1 Tax=Lepeophtheirus salmonis TaxID=72036 RepID=A0A0K2VJR5_LEPSM